jgi:phospholipase C
VSANARRLLSTTVALGCIALIPEALAQTTGLDAIQHVIVIYQENWSFDGLYGKFPGADGIANAGDRVKQVKKDGTPYLKLPQPLDTAKKPPIPDPRFPADLPVAPYDAARFVPPHQKTATSSIMHSRRSAKSTAGAWTGSSPGATTAGSR